MSPDPLYRSTLDSIYDQVLDNLKISGQYDSMRVSLIDPSWTDPDFQTIINDFVEKCKKFCSQMDLRKNRKDLRASLDDNFPGDHSSNIMLKKCIEKILEARKSELKEQFTQHAEDYLRKEFQQESPTHNDDDNQADVAFSPSPKSQHDNQEPDIDMEIESTFGEEPDAPTYSPLSCDEADIILNHTEPDIHPSQNNIEPNMTVDTGPSLEDIPIPPEDIPILPEDEESHTPLQDELSQENKFNDELELLTLSSVSSVHTNELSDFDQTIGLSDDDEANIVGQPKNSRIKIGELQGTIDDLQTRADKSEAEEPQGSRINMHCETSESDAYSDNATTGRRATRQRKSNPRYSNEHFTS